MQDLLKPNSLIGVNTSIELGTYEARLFNVLIYVWQKNAKENLFDSIGYNPAVSLTGLIKTIKIDKGYASRDNFIEEVFNNLFNCEVELKDCVLPQVDDNGNLIFDNGILKFSNYSRVKFRLIDYWGRNKNKDFHSFDFKINPMVKGLIHYQTLLTKGNGVGFSKLSLDTLSTIKSAKAIRLYELLVRENSKGRDRVVIEYEKMSKIIYISNEKKRINESLKRLSQQLEHLVSIEKEKITDPNCICLKFKFK